MRIKSSIRNKLILAVFLGCLIPYSIGGLYLKTYIENMLYNNSVMHSGQMLQQVNEYIDEAFIVDMKEEVSLLASFDKVKNAYQGLNNYTSYNNSFLYQEYDTEKGIEEYFRFFKESHIATNFIFLGTEDGGYMEYPRFSPKENYDPRLRPWYQDTINQKDIVISEPYITNVTNEMVISFMKRITNGNDTIGVVGLSVKLDDLRTNISKIRLEENGYILVLSPKFKFLVSENHPDWILKTPEELGLSGFEKLENNKTNSFETVIDGGNYTINGVQNDNGMYILSVLDQKHIMHSTRLLSNILIIIYLITFIVIVLIIYCVSKRFTKPILEISSVIRRMTDFDFCEEINLKDYINRTDEIGNVSSALVDMHNNYFEMMEQINIIDDEIKNINIEKNNRYRPGLSEHNPFHGVIGSIGTLLENIYLYFDQLKARNNEISTKNDLLTATEEELIAQLDEINRQKEYINFLAYQDPLTELPNRRNYLEYLTKKITTSTKLAVILVDLDDFKGINDTRGHVFGDRVLKEIAKRFERVIDSTIFVSRFGGDEFLILIEYQEDKVEIERSVDRINQLFSERIHVDDIEVEIHYSMGIALFPKDSADVDQLIIDADLAMYSVKNSGKDGYKFFHSGMLDYQIKISNTEDILRSAIKNDGFKIVYQPQVEVVTGRIIGYEALVRLKNSNLSPTEFIGVAEKNGMIIKIGRIVTEKVIAQQYEWKMSGMDIKPVAINFSASQLHDTDYICILKILLEKYEIDSKFIEIEITESIFLENKQITLSFLKQLREMGIKIAIDDFGTGYSSLNYLTFLPVDIIKLDRSLNIRFLEIKNVKVMDSLILLIHSLGLTVIAEGIETRDQVKTLNKANCDQIQGYYFSKPLEVGLIPAINTTIFDID